MFNGLECLLIGTVKRLTVLNVCIAVNGRVHTVYRHGCFIKPFSSLVIPLFRRQVEREKKAGLRLGTLAERYWGVSPDYHGRPTATSGASRISSGRAEKGSCWGREKRDDVRGRRGTISGRTRSTRETKGK